MTVKPPQSQDVPSGFDPGQQDPTIRFGVWGDNDVGPGVVGSSGRPAASGPDGDIETGTGVLGVNTANQGIGVHGTCRRGTGISGTSASGTGVSGFSPDGVGVHAAGDTGIVASGTRFAGRFTGNVGIGTATPSAALEIDRGTTDDVALRLASSGSTWGSGLQLRNTSDSARTYGTFVGSDGMWHFTDVDADIDRLVIDQNGRIGLGIGADEVRTSLHVEGTEIHSGGPVGGLSFADRTTEEFVESPTEGERWVWYAQGGTARLWSGQDRLTVSTTGEGLALDVPRRMRVRQGGDSSAGIWFLQDTPNADRAFVGMADDTHVGFWGNTGAGWGLRVDTSTGDVAISGSLTKGGGGFKIDHPLHPAEEYLSHSFVESPEMVNIYNGNVVTDDQGEATVVLPDFFEALNRDYCYQLTPVGDMAQAAVTRTVRDNSFAIRTDKPGVTVSWQVTGVRQDHWANAHRIIVEEAKPDGEQNRYLHPELSGQPAARGIVLAPQGERTREGEGHAHTS